MLKNVNKTSRYHVIEILSAVLELLLAGGLTRKYRSKLDLYEALN